MSSLLTSRELRFLLAGLGSVVWFVAFGLLAWWSPLSPVALERPAAQMAAGDVQGALQSYQDLANSWAPRRVREEASWRVGLLADVELGDPEAAAMLLQDFVADFPDSRHTASAHVRVAHIYANQMGEPLLAAESWEMAAVTATDRSEAGAWLLAAGRAYSEVEETRRAIITLLAATAHQDYAAAAWLTLARMHIAEDPGASYEYYGEAMRASPNESERRLARLGMATALEHMEYRDEALAAVDQALEEDGDDDAALRRRRHRLQSIYQQ